MTTAGVARWYVGPTQATRAGRARTATTNSNCSDLVSPASAHRAPNHTALGKLGRRQNRYDASNTAATSSRTRVSARPVPSFIQ